MIERNLYIGGLFAPGMPGLGQVSDAALSPAPRNDAAHTLESQHEGRHWPVIQFPDARVCIRGVACRQGDEAAGAPDVADFVCREYRRTGNIPIDALEGSFTLVVLDDRNERIVLYRNLVGTGFTYYGQTPTGLFFSSNLAELVRRVPSLAAPNDGAIPSLFLFRFVPGRETLFEHVFRVLPGEQVVLDRRGIHRAQRQTLDSLRGQWQETTDPTDRLDKLMQRIVAGYLRDVPQTANLLSGGIDSSYIQAHMGTVTRARGMVPKSYCAHIEHPYTMGDAEYALSAAQALDVDHELVTVPLPVLDRLQETIVQTAEPLSHVQSGYFLWLAREMCRAGRPLALCGEGADSLFGMGDLLALQRAAMVRRLLFTPGLRRMAARSSGLVGQTGIRDLCLLAEDLSDEQSPHHFINCVARFTDWDSAAAAFPPAALAQSLASRRGLLDTVHAGDNVLERIHAIGYFGEGIDSASLWATLFNAAGGDMLCPFLDSRMLRFAINLPGQARFPYGRPKHMLKTALSRYVPRKILDRPKLGFGQPIFEWMSPGGELRERVESIGDYPFLSRPLREKLLAEPNWFLYSLLCYDIWRQAFVSKRSESPARLADSGTLSLAAPGQESSS